jgi:hypothetical protein
VSASICAVSQRRYGRALALRKVSYERATSGNGASSLKLAPVRPAQTSARVACKSSGSAIAMQPRGNLELVVLVDACRQLIARAG